MIKKRYANLKCCARRCSSKHVSWIIENPWKRSNDDSDMVPEPLGFCSSTHLERFIHDYNTGYYMEPIKPRYLKVKRK